MPPISNLNVQIGPNQTGTGGIGTTDYGDRKSVV